MASEVAQVVAPEKVMIFIDGQNLLYACSTFSRKSGTGKKFWYDDSKLERMLLNLRPNRKLIQVRYYTAVAEIDPFRPNDDKRFSGQMNALSILASRNKWYVFSKLARTFPVLCPYCKRKDKEIIVVCPDCNKQILMPKNKGVDVALAADLLIYGLHDKYPYDTAIVVSGDTDFAPVIDSIKIHRPEVRIEVAQFMESVGDKLKFSPNVNFYELDNKTAQFGKFV
ncbi:MAG: NYN domain-containing protein [Candidatus Bathyarchaeia archaeon]